MSLAGGGCEWKAPKYDRFEKSWIAECRCGYQSPLVKFYEEAATALQEHLERRTS